MRLSILALCAQTRYVSERNGQHDTVAHRIKKLMESIPPKEGRNSRLGHISIEDFADLIGSSKQRVIDWRKGTSFPDETNRARLEAVSGGRYSADDFKRPTEAEQQARLEELSGEVEDLRFAIGALLRLGSELCAQVEELGGLVPPDVLEEIARAGLRMQPEARRR